MCDVCEKQGKTFEMLKPFLKEDVVLRFKTFEDGFQKIYLRHEDEELTITADGDEGGYFHFKPEIPNEEEMEPEEEVLFVDLDYVSSSKQWSLDPKLTVNQINKALPGILHRNTKNGKVSDSYKVKNEWIFSYKGKECNIWDYKGSKWSAYGPRWVFDELGLTIVGT